MHGCLLCPLGYHVGGGVTSKADGRLLLAIYKTKCIGLGLEGTQRAARYHVNLTDL